MTTDQPGGRRQSVEQERAAYAWNKINKVQASAQKVKTQAMAKAKGTTKEIEDIGENARKKYEAEYRSLVRGFGAMVLANGLGPALAFLYAKGKGENEEKKANNSDKSVGNAHATLLDQIASWLQDQHIATPPRQPQNSHQSVRTYSEIPGGWLLAWVGHQDTSLVAYRRARTEALAILLWLKRFAEGALEEPEGQQGGASESN